MKVGDVVALKSGGPRMVIQEINDNLAYTVWFKNETKQKGEFQLDVLEPSSERLGGMVTFRM